MNKLIVSSSPHIRTKHDTPRLMLDVIIALLPAVVAGAIIYGIRALLVVFTCVLTAVVSEFLFNLAVKKEQTVFDFSAIITGLILGLSLRADAPVWQCVLGSVFAIVVVKCLFGGLGANFANPAATGRVFMLVCFSGTLAGGVAPKLAYNPDLVAGATPLEAMSKGQELPSIVDMLLGTRGGSIGETCMIALALGFIYLVARKIINFETPLIMIATVFVLSLIVTGDVNLALYQVLGGGLVFGAVFMATDFVTTPITRTGKMIFAFGCGLITFLIRFFGNYPEGVSFAILFMNILTPYIEGWTKPRALGKRGSK
ncbi:MAG: RnfABCDGE type electron transport complex subunit D [Clostridia bacterium]|nr:RnfABCDGE type electron transport complex subunit D [Clostridia bacterium]